MDHLGGPGKSLTLLRFGIVPIRRRRESAAPPPAGGGKDTCGTAAAEFSGPVSTAALRQGVCAPCCIRTDLRQNQTETVVPCPVFKALKVLGRKCFRAERYLQYGCLTENWAETVCSADGRTAPVWTNPK